MKIKINKILKISSVILSAALVVSTLTMDINAASMGESLPVAGAAKALNEGKSITSLQADQIRKSTAGESLATVAAESNAVITINKAPSTILETEENADPAIMTVGAASVAVEEVKPENEEVATTAGEATKDTASVSENEVDDESSDSTEATEEVSEEDLFSAITGDSKKAQEFSDEERGFMNLVIAQVNDYVNVRSGPSEEEEIVGKLYNNSVGDLLETEGDWYKIKSGNCTGYVKGEFCVTGEEAVELAKQVGTRMAKVTTTTLYVRAQASTESEVLGMVPMDDELTVSEELDGWVKVSVEEGDGYVSTEFVSLYTDFVRAESKEEEEARLAKEEAARKAAREAARKAAAKTQKQSSNSGSSAPAANYQAAGSGNGSNVANFALQFVGNPYVYGGTSLTNGADCSGFVMSVYRNFGISLPHSSGGDRSVGYNVGGLANAQPGDIVCYSGHVAIYIGGGQIVHASTAKTGIKVSNANYRNVLAVRRIF